MARIVTEHATSVIFEHFENDRLTRAMFDWKNPPVKDTYTIAPHNFVSVELDSHFPVRPSEVDWHAHSKRGNRGLKEIKNLFGEEFAEAMSAVRYDLGYLAIASYEIDGRHRDRIAKMQIDSPSTPVLLQRLCREIIVGSSHKK